MTDTQITELNPIETVYALLGLTEANGGMALVTQDEVAVAIQLYPQSYKYAASSIAMNLANAAAIANDPQQFALQGVMSVAWRDPAAHWRAVAKALISQADAEYNRDRQAPNAVMTELRTRYEVEEAAEYSPARSHKFNR